MFQVLRFSAVAFVIAGLGIFTSPTRADEPIRYFRIGTGPANTMYFSVGALIANAISNPPGNRPCEEGGSCGVPGLIATAQTTQGQIENITAVQDDIFQATMARGDYAYWAYHGTGPFKKSGPQTNIGVIAGLYPEQIHIAVAMGSPWRDLQSLKGKKIALGPKESENLPLVRLVLQAAGLSEKKIKPVYLSDTAALDQLRRGKIDAAILIGPAPLSSLSNLGDDMPVKLLPLEDQLAAKLQKENPFLSATVIPAGTYRNVPATATLAVDSVLLVSQTEPADLIKKVTASVWNPASAAIFAQSGLPLQIPGPVPQHVPPVIPFHPGAEQYYHDASIGIGQPKIP